MKFALGLLLVALSVPRIGADTTTLPTEGKVVVLKPVKVQGTATSNFPIDIRIYADPATKKVARIFITRVAEHSEAAVLGLEVGDEIVKIDGAPVAGMDPTVAKESPIGKLFLNRQAGDALHLEVTMRRTKSITLHAQPSLN